MSAPLGKQALGDILRLSSLTSEWYRLRVSLNRVVGASWAYRAEHPDNDPVAMSLHRKRNTPTSHFPQRWTRIETAIRGASIGCCSYTRHTHPRVFARSLRDIDTTAPHTDLTLRLDGAELPCPSAATDTANVAPGSAPRAASIASSSKPVRSASAPGAPSSGCCGSPRPSAPPPSEPPGRPPLRPANPAHPHRRAPRRAPPRRLRYPRLGVEARGRPPPPRLSLVAQHHPTQLGRAHRAGAARSLISRMTNPLA